MKVKFFRFIAILGMGMALGPGLAFPNDFDMVFRLGGTVVAMIGALGMVTASRKLPSEDLE